MGASAALGGLGLVTGFLQNQQARGDANRANSQAQEQAWLNYLMQKGVVDRQTALYDTLKGTVDSAAQAGQFDPGKFLGLLRDDTALNERQDLGGLAASMRTLGYAPGDSEAQVRMDAVRNKYDLSYRQQDADIRRALFGDKLGAYSGIAGVLQGAGAGANSASLALQNQYNQQAQNAYGRMQNPAGLIQAILPFLQTQKSGSTNVPATPNVPSSFNFVPNLQYGATLFDQYQLGGRKNNWGF